MAYDAALLHVFESFENQDILAGVKFDVVVDSFVDEIAARAIFDGGVRTCCNLGLEVLRFAQDDNLIQLAVGEMHGMGPVQQCHSPTVEKNYA